MCVCLPANCYKSETFSVCYRCPKVHDRLGCLQYTFPTSITDLFLFLSVLNSLSFSFSCFSPHLHPPSHTPRTTLQFAVELSCLPPAVLEAAYDLPQAGSALTRQWNSPVFFFQTASGTKGFTLMSCRDDSQKLMLYMRTKTTEKNGNGFNVRNELGDAANCIW